MKCLTFEDSAAGDARVRAMRFEERSLMPLAAACAVASAVRETLGELLGASVRTRLSDPAIPSPAAWSAIARDALIYRIRASLADAAIVLRRRDAVAMACGMLGEVDDAPAQREPSPIECRVLDRAVQAIAAGADGACGAVEGRAERVGAIAGFTTFFELFIETPLRARIGVALSKDPVPEPQGRLGLADLSALALPSRVILDIGGLQARRVAGLAPGDVVPITSSSLLRGRVEVGGRTLAQGQCGIVGGRYALCVDGTAASTTTED